MSPSTYFITPGVGMSLATPSTAQTFETTVVNNNFILLENAILLDRTRIGLGIFTSTTRPGAPVASQTIIETDTRNTMYWNGTRWVPMDAMPNAASAVLRDALYPTPVQGNQVYRTDFSYSEVYYGLFNVTTAPLGARVAGWYPAPGADIYIRIGGSAAQQNLLSGASVVQAASFGVPKSNLPLANAASIYSNGYFQWNGNNGQMKVLVEGRYSVKARTQVSNTTGILQAYIMKNAIVISTTNALAFQDFQLASSATHTAFLEADSVELLASDFINVVLGTTVSGNSNSNVADGGMLFHLRWSGVIHA